MAEIRTHLIAGEVCKGWNRTACGKEGWGQFLPRPSTPAEYSTTPGSLFEATDEPGDVTCKSCIRAFYREPPSPTIQGDSNV